MIVVCLGVELHERIEINLLDGSFGLIERCYQLLDDRLIGIRTHSRCKFQGCGDGSRRSALGQDQGSYQDQDVLSAPLRLII